MRRLIDIILMVDCTEFLCSPCLTCHNQHQGSHTVWWSNVSISMCLPLIAKEQLKQTNFKQNFLKTHGSSKLGIKTIEKLQLIAINDKIAIPKSWLNRILKWYNDYRNHPGSTRMHKTLENVFYLPKMKVHSENHVKHCRACHIFKEKHQKIWQPPTKRCEKNE